MSQQKQVLSSHPILKTQLTLCVCIAIYIYTRERIIASYYKWPWVGLFGTEAVEVGGRLGAMPLY